MNKKIGFIITVIFSLIVFIGLDYIINMDSSDDPTKNIEVIEEEDPRGFIEKEKLSKSIIYEDDKILLYEDRVFEHFSYKKEDIENLSKAFENLKKELPKDVNSYVVPVPSRIIFEDGYDKDKLNYDQFYNKVEEEFLDLAKVVDLRNTLSFHKDEYIFYRTSDSITARGGYYASEKVINSMGIDLKIPLKEYNEHKYNEYIGSERYLINLEIDNTSKEYDLLTSIPPDLTYFYLLPNSMNVSEVFLLDNEVGLRSRKQPTVVKSGTGGGAMISGKKFQWALVEGDGKDKAKKNETLLLIGDTSSRYMLPYFSNYYKNIYYVNIKWNKMLGSEKQMIKDIFKEYEIKDVVYAQDAKVFGNFSNGVIIKRFFKGGLE